MTEGINLLTVDIKKILLLTDIPPCKGYTAGLVLEQLCKLLPVGSIACFLVQDARIEASVSPDLKWMEIETCRRPIEYSGAIYPQPLGSLLSFTVESYNELRGIRGIIDKAVLFGKTCGVDSVWCTLEGQTMIGIALPVAKGLGVPLYSHVWDPPFWWLRDNKVNGFTTARILRKFAKTLRYSKRCFAASPAMALAFKSEYNLETVSFLPSLPVNLAYQPATRLHEGEYFTIGIAGQIYATDEWNALLSALSASGWMVGGRKIRIRYLGARAQLQVSGPVRIEFCGWNSQEETLRLLSESDVQYCPYWFNPQFETEARLSFPAKLTTYLAAGRPVLFHGPEYASPARFLEENSAGLCCYSLNKDDIIASIDKLINNPALYKRLCENGHAAFRKYMTLAEMKKNFSSFLGVQIG